MKVLRTFRDKETKVRYVVGDTYSSKNKERVKHLASKGLILVDEVDEKLTKAELLKLATDKGLEVTDKNTKKELIELLKG